MADQRDFNFAAFECVLVLGELLDDIGVQVGMLEQGEGLIFSKGWIERARDQFGGFALCTFAFGH
jgi:hypothetical protein